MALTALLIRLTSPGPIFFLQERVGKNGEAFKLIKFRSMYRQDGDSRIPVLSGLNDKRVTPLGRFLRRTHIDEFPQLFNVLNGTMSLVGPRPELPFFVESYSQHIPFYSDRFVIKPGITGMAQVYGAYHSKAEEKLIFDLNYIHNLNMVLDCKICLLTVVNALAGLFKPPKI